jgi:hypothetical protein
MTRIALLALVLAAACGTTTRFTPTNPSPHAMQPKPAEAVHVYTSGPPQIAYVEVGIIQSRQSSEFSTHEMPEVIQKMRTEAGRIGCDGVIINGPNNETRNSLWLEDNDVHTLEGFWGACIVYGDYATASR